MLIPVAEDSSLKVTVLSMLNKMHLKLHLKKTQTLAFFKATVTH